MKQPNGMERIRRSALAAWGRFVADRPRLTIALSVVLAAVSAMYAAGALRFESDRSELIDPRLPWQQRYAEFRRAFPRWDDAVVVVDARSAPSPRALDEFLDSLETALRAATEVRAVTAGFPTRDAPVGLALSQPLARVEQIAIEASRATPALQAPSFGHLLSLGAMGLSAGAMDERSAADLADLLDRAAAIGERAGPRPSDGAATPGARAPTVDDPSPPLLMDLPRIQRLTTPSGAFAFVLVSLQHANGAGPGSVQSAQAAGVRAVRERLVSLRADPRFSTIDAGVTGVPVLEADETALSTSDSSRSSALAAALIALMAVAVYRGVSVPALIMIGLGLGLAASFGWAALAVGRLQTISVVFMVMLVGLGADMTMHLISRLEVTHPDHDHMGEAIRDSFETAGPGIITGSITTAAAFAAMALTPFVGVAELGVIAAGGVLLCTLLSLAFFPAALMLLPKPERRLRGHDGGVSRPFLGGRLNFVDRRAWTVIGAWAVLIAAGAPLALRVRYDTDLLRLMPDAAESVRWERRLAQDDEQSVWHAVVVAKSTEDARATADRLRALPEVSEVGAAGMLFPEHLDAKREILSTIPEPPARAPDAAPLDPRPLAHAIANSAGPREGLRLAALRVAALTDDRVATVNAAFSRERDALAAQIRSLRVASPPTVGDLPGALREQFIGTGGELLLRVYPRAPETKPGEAPASVLSPERLGPFMRAVLAAAPDATGPTSQIYESSRVIIRANILAFALAALAIVVALFIDFRRLGDVLCSLIPVLVATLGLLVLLGLLRIDLNFANTIVAPLLLGLGVTAGVNAVHRWRQQPFDPPAGLAGGAGRAITLTLATTAIGFACMLTAQHRGVRSLGFVMTLGLVLVWAATTLLLPAVLRLRARRLYHSPPPIRAEDARPRPAPALAGADG